MSQICSTHTEIKDDMDTKPTVIKVLKTLLHETAYRTPNIPNTNKSLEDIMRADMHARKIVCPQLEKTIHLTASLIELGYNGCTMTEKINIALYTWFIIYVDDTSSKNVGPFCVFTQRFVNRLPQLDPVLDALVETLSRMCELYDTQTANYILAATFNYVHATCLETEIQASSLMRGVFRFPWFFRDHSGLSIAFALMLFPKSKGLCFIDYVQVLEDMNFWTSGVNDILSFHKEELVGEKGNYIHNRSHVEEKTPSKVLTEICQEVLVSRKTIYTAFAHVPRAKEIWAGWELGYIRWHLIQDRYKLATLNL